MSGSLDAVNGQILGMKHVVEEEYAGLAVLQVVTGCINMDLKKLLQAVKNLLGESDFSFHIVSAQNPSEQSN